METLSARDITEFNAYLRTCTDGQVIGVLEKERKAQRWAYSALAQAEADRRGLE